MILSENAISLSLLLSFSLSSHQIVVEKINLVIVVIHLMYKSILAVVVEQQISV